jgi:hypothetical protein
MVVVCVRPSRERCIDLNATVSAFVAGGTEQRTKGCGLGLAGGPLARFQARSAPVQFASILSREDYPCLRVGRPIRF